MYEAIQEANREMYLQKLKHSNNMNRAQPSTYSLQWITTFFGDFYI